MEKAIQRWVVDITKWDPSPQEFSSTLNLLNQDEHSSITRFVKMEDRKRALVSRLLQYALAHEVIGIPYEEISIKRTEEGKPYLECDPVGLKFPNFNFNVSHHGDYVAIASEPLCLVGLDIVSYAIPQTETIPEFIQNFSSYFSRLEWDKIINVGSHEEILIQFYRYWCLKEAYVKATGNGLACQVDKVEFHHTNWTNISVKIDGVHVKEWRFWLFGLGNRHWVSIARGHPRAATASYKRTLTRVEYSDEEYSKGLYLPNASFIFKTVEELSSLVSHTRTEEKQYC